MDRKRATYRTRLNRVGGTAVIAGLLTVGIPDARADVSTSPARAVAFETRQLTNVAINTASVTGQILKAKPKQVLTVTVSVRTLLPNNTLQNLVAIAQVNGVALTTPGTYNTNCPVGNTCVVSGQWIV